MATFPGDDLDDQELFVLIAETDRELFEAGVEIGRRTWDVPIKVMQKLGYTGYVMSGPGRPKIFERIQSRMRSIYAAKEFASGGHIGVFMYRDIFVRITPPIIFGTVRINPFDFVELTRDQKEMINQESEQVVGCIDQFCDVADVQYGLGELRPEVSDWPLAVHFASLARLHLHASAAILTGGYDVRGAVQSGLLATELALKSLLSLSGVSEQELKVAPFGHNTRNMLDRLVHESAEVDAERIATVIALHPPLVENRYSQQQPPRVEIGHIVMGSQFVLAECVRNLSDRRFRDGFEGLPARACPALPS